MSTNKKFEVTIALTDEKPVKTEVEAPNERAAAKLAFERVWLGMAGGALVKDPTTDAVSIFDMHLSDLEVAAKRVSDEELERRVAEFNESVGEEDRITPIVSVPTVRYPGTQQLMRQPAPGGSFGEVKPDGG